MNKVILFGTLCLVISTASAASTELPSMCFDGTYAGGGECEILVNGELVDTGLVGTEFFAAEGDATKALDDLYQSLHDSIKEQ